jgi:hypothetical protein
VRAAQIGFIPYRPIRAQDDPAHQHVLMAAKVRQPQPRDIMGVVADEENTAAQPA